MDVEPTAVLEVLTLVALVATLVRRRKRRLERLEALRRRNPRTCWVRSWISERNKYGVWETLIPQLASEDRRSFKKLLRVNPELFLELLERIGPFIRRQVPWMRQPLGPGLRLAITLRYLATGEAYSSLEFLLRVPNNSICGIVPETCQVLYDKLRDEFMPMPQTPEDWKEIANSFAKRWNWFNCLGALDGKHVPIKRPANSGTMHYNYKVFFSVVLMALVDSNYKFIYIHVGDYGSASDGGIFEHSSFRRAIEGKRVTFPAAEPLPGDDVPVPYSIVGDEAFPLMTWLLKPIARSRTTQECRIFNYRLSRARRIVENAFGILSQRFRFLKMTMEQKPPNVVKIVQGACALHNLMRTRYPTMTNRLVDREDHHTHQMIPGAWRDHEALTCLQRHKGNRLKNDGKVQREYLMKYYHGPGSVPWQHNMI